MKRNLFADKQFESWNSWSSELIDFYPFKTWWREQPENSKASQIKNTSKFTCIHVSWQNTFATLSVCFCEILVFHVLLKLDYLHHLRSQTQYQGFQPLYPPNISFVSSLWHHFWSELFWQDWKWLDRRFAICGLRKIQDWAGLFDWKNIKLNWPPS